MPRVVVIGSANVDFTITLERLPQMGETLSGGEYYRSLGGKGANQAVAALRAGAEVRFVGRIGLDANGWAIFEGLTGLGIPADGILRDESLPSGVAFIMVDRSGDNAIAVAPGCNRSLSLEDVRRADSLFAWGQVLLIQLEVPLEAVQEALRLARIHGLLTILNPAPARALPKEILSEVDILTPNESELRMLSKMGPHDLPPVVDRANGLIASGVGSVVVTLGRQGAMLVRDDLTQSFPAFSVEAVDSTAAGDAFNGALACALAEGRVFEEAIRFGMAAGAVCVTRRGAQDALPTRSEIEALLWREM